MGDEAVWVRCRDALRQLGSGVVWADAAQVAATLRERSGEQTMTEGDVRRVLDDHALAPTRGSSFPLFLSDGHETGDGVNQVAGYVSLCRRAVSGYSSYWGAVLAPGFSAEAKTIAKDRSVSLCEYVLCAEYTKVPLH